MTFRLTTLFYVTALLAAALAAFGWWGLLAVAGVPLLRGFCLWIRRHPVAVIAILGIGFLLWVFVYPMTVPNVYRSLGPGHAMQLWNMSVVLQEMRNDGQRPQATFVPERNQHSQSWRVATAAYMDLFEVDQYRHEEPWDSPHNLQIGRRYPGYPLDRYHGPPVTTLAVSDPRTAWPPEGLLDREAIGDGPENTICLIDSIDMEILWTEPRDLTFDEVVELLTTPPTATSRDWHEKDHGYFHHKQRYRMILMCSGDILFLNAPLDRETAAAMLTANGGERIDWDAIDAGNKPRLNMRKVMGLVMFLGLAAMSVHPATRKRIVPKEFNTETRSHGGQPEG